MKTVKAYVRSLPDEEKRLIINGYVEFERNGAIGDDPLRLHTEAFIEGISGDHHMIVMWMEKLAFEAYRYYAELMLEEIDDPLSPRNQARAEWGLD